MTITKGEEFTFVVTVLESESFIAQDLTNINLLNCYFKLVKLLDDCIVSVGSATIAVNDALNGKLNVTLDAIMTGSLTSVTGAAVDDYYLKPTYKGIIHLEFTDATPNRTAIVDKIYVASLGIVCV